jgi:hypothetical protein
MGVQGNTGATGPTGPTGATAPVFIATGIVNDDGTNISLLATTGPMPSITWNAASHNYLISINGMGSGCPIPQVTAYSRPVLFYQQGGGSCHDGSLFNFAVAYADGGRGIWSYMFVGQ